MARGSLLTNDHESIEIVVIVIVVIAVSVASGFGIVIVQFDVVIGFVSLRCLIQFRIIIHRLDDATALADGRGRGVRVFLIRSTLRTQGDFPTEIVELGLTAEANIFRSQVGHVLPLSPQKAPQR